jgi:hypothetical protein
VIKGSSATPYRQLRKTVRINKKTWKSATPYRQLRNYYLIKKTSSFVYCRTGSLEMNKITVT